MINKYTCIECGYGASELYKDLNGGGVIKISHCGRCGRVVDKYIEYDPVLIFLDAVLHKRQAYRHILYNISMSTWKLVLIFLLCDAYIKWDNLDIQQSFSASRDEHIFYAALEWDIYKIFAISAVEWLLGILAAVGLLMLDELRLNFPVHSSNATQQIFSSSYIEITYRALVISSFGKLLAVPAVVWGQTHSTIYLTLAKAFVLTSNISAVQTIRNAGRYSTVVILILIHISQYAIGQWIVTYLYT